MQAGDIFLVPHDAKAYSSWLDRFSFSQINRYQKYFLELPEPACEFVHIGLVSEWPYGIHSTLDKGVNIVNVAERYPEARICRVRKCTNIPQLGKDINENAKKYLGRPYDNLANFKFALPVLFSYLRSAFGMTYNCRGFNCISFVIQSIRDTGVDIGWKLAPKLITPGMVYMDDNIYDINPTAQSINSRPQGIIPEFVERAKL